MDNTVRFYSQSSYAGAGFPVFAGARRLRGGGILGSLSKIVLPLVKQAGRALFRSAGKQALGLAGDVAASMSQGEGISGLRGVLKNQGLKRLKTVGSTALRQLPGAVAPLLGAQLARAPAAAPQRSSLLSTILRKRTRSPTKSRGTTSHPPAKRRRTAPRKANF